MEVEQTSRFGTNLVEQAGQHVGVEGDEILLAHPGDRTENAIAHGSRLVVARSAHLEQHRRHSVASELAGPEQPGTSRRSGEHERRRTGDQGAIEVEERRARPARRHRHVLAHMIVVADDSCSRHDWWAHAAGFRLLSPIRGFTRSLRHARMLWKQCPIAAVRLPSKLLGSIGVASGAKSTKKTERLRGFELFGMVGDVGGANDAKDTRTDALPEPTRLTDATARPTDRVRRAGNLLRGPTNTAIRSSGRSSSRRAPDRDVVGAPAGHAERRGSSCSRIAGRGTA